MPDPRLLRLLLCASLVDLSANMPTTILPLLLLAERHSAQQAAATMFVPLLVGLLLTLPSGPLVDRIGQHKSLSVSVAGLAITTAALFTAHSLESIAAILALRAACGVLFMTASFVAAASSEDAKRRLYGVTWLAMAVTISFSIGPALSTFLWQHGIHQIQFSACAAICALAFFCVPPREQHRAVERSTPAPRIPYGAWAAPLCFCVAVSAISGVNTTLAVVGLHARGLNGGLFFSGTAIGMLIGRIPSAKIVHRYGAVTAAGVLVVVMLFGGSIVALATAEIWLAAGAVFIGAAWSCMLPACSTLLLAASSPATRGRAMAAYTFAMSFGAVIGGAGATRLSGLPNGYAIALELACGLPPIALIFLFASERRRAVFQARAAVSPAD
jgi:MFS family permease